MKNADSEIDFSLTAIKVKLQLSRKILVESLFRLLYPKWEYLHRNLYENQDNDVSYGDF